MRRPGPQIRDDGIAFSVVSRHARAISVCLFDEGGAEVERIPLARVSASHFEGVIAGLPVGSRYGLRAEGPTGDRDGHRFDPAKLLLDPYAIRLDRAFTYDARLAVPDLDTADLVPKAVIEALPPSAAPLPPGRPGLVYEVSVRAFTKLHPQVPEAQRGTVRALAHPAVVEHMKRIGVGTVELMPLTAAIDERHLGPLGLSNAWGYNPVSFMAPDPRLAPGGFAEIRETVAALHAAGLRVVLDVVFNHTGESDALGPSLSLKGLDQALYFRLDGAGRLVNDTGCGNTLALDRPETVALVMDALRTWASVGLDGFRYDLGTILGRRADGFDREAPLLTAIRQDPALRDLLHIAEPWDVGPGGYQVGAFPEPFAEWNDRYRDDVRRFWRGDGGIGALATRLAGSSDIFAGSGRSPSASVNFVAAHDGMTLADCVAFATKHNEANGESNRDGTSDNHSWNHGIEGPTRDPGILAARTRDIKAMLATLLVSRGTPMLTAGDEFGRTQSGNNNAYAQDNALTWLDWDHRDTDLEALVAGFAALRARHPALDHDAWLSGTGVPADVVWHSPRGQMSGEDWSDPSLRLLAMELSLPEADDHLLAVFNAGDETDMVLPQPWRDGHWTIAAATVPARPENGRIVVPARSVVVLADSGPPEAKGRATGISEAELRAFAWSQGVAPEWWSIAGTCTHVPPDGLRAVLGSLGLSVTTRADLREAAAARDEDRRRPLPVTAVLAGEAPVLTLTLPVGGRPKRIELVLETGSRRRTVQAATADLAVLDGFAIGTERFERLALPLPGLAVGVHGARIGHCRATLLVAPPQCHQPEELAAGGKVFGLSAHLYALTDRRGRGIGDLETLARFGEAAGRLGAALAGLNPLHHLFLQDRSRTSPYQPSDRRFIDPIYIDPDAAAATLGLAAPALATTAQTRLVDYPAVWAETDAALRVLHAGFEAAGRDRTEYETFVAAGGPALADHALFQAIARQHGGVSRSGWDRRLAGRDPTALGAFAGQHAAEIRYHLFLQWLADRQLGTAAARSATAGLGIGLYRDLAVGTALDGGEIWANPERFAPGMSVGAPPDPFSADGQVWNLPPPNPRTLVQEGLAPWLEVLRANMRHAGALRIDHILGFARLFFVPAGGTGRDGAYVSMPRDALIAATAIASHEAKCLVIGEDLGTAEPGLTPALETAGILSSRVMWFERDGAGFADPSRHPYRAAASLSTHDLPTLAGWRAGRDIAIDRALGRVDIVEEAVRRGARAEEVHRLGIASGDPTVSAEAVHAFLGRSGAGVVMAQVEDLVGEIEPLNVPGTDTEWPNWRRRVETPVETLPDLTEAKAIAEVLAHRPGATGTV